MYLPYLRGKQFELLASREIAPRIAVNRNISPIIEPVKKSASGLKRCVESLIERNINFNIIINPVNGEFVGDTSGLIQFIRTKLNNYENFQFGIIVNQFTNLDFITSELTQIGFNRPISLIHLDRLNDIEALADWVGQYEIRYNLFGENFPARRYRGIITPETKVLLDDKFRPQAKNADYLNHPDEFFSDDHLYFRDDGFVAFSDYLTIGNDYAETGFLPYAVAIHLTYVKPNNQIWIRHFVSDSNEDTTDVAGKFGEALEKLIAFIDEHNIQTDAANEFRSYHVDEHYPGLGSLKKLSIKHHLELVDNLLVEQ